MLKLFVHMNETGHLQVSRDWRLATTTHSEIYIQDESEVNTFIDNYLSDINRADIEAGWVLGFDMDKWDYDQFKEEQE